MFAYMYEGFVCVCVRVCFMFVQGLLLWIDLRKGLCMRRGLKCAFAYDRVGLA